MKKYLLNVVQAIDRVLLHSTSEKSHVAVLLFHKIFENSHELLQDITMPHERLTVADFEQVLHFFAEAGYHFISPSQMNEQAAVPNEKRLLLSFDDGYFNNTLILPVLEKYNAPVLFFIATAYTHEEEPYWWDILYRERRKRGSTFEQIIEEVEYYKTVNRNQIRNRLEDAFGRDCYLWQDIDRPLTASELYQFALHPLVHIGNHTHEHYALAHWPPSVVKFQIKEAQDFLQRTLQCCIDAFAYPNGSISKDALPVFAELGISYAYTLNQDRNYLPIENLWSVGRFGMPLYKATHNMWQSYRHDKPPVLENFLRKYILQQ